MKKLIKVGIIVIVIVILGFIVKDNYNVITDKAWYIYRKYLQADIKQNLEYNNYSKKENYMYVKINNNTILKNKEDTKNMIYTFLDAGWDTYMTKCDPDYLTCADDIKKIVQDNAYLTDLSNYVHPFNTFNKVNTTFTSGGKITLKKKKKIYR